MAKLTLKDKVELYENVLKEIRRINSDEVASEGLAQAPDEKYAHAFALGWVKGKLGQVVRDAAWALNQGAKK